LNLVTGPHKFWEAIKKFRNSHIFKVNDSSIKQSDISSYISGLAPAGVHLKMETYKNNFAPSFFNHKISLEELKEIIESLKSKSSPDPDLLDHSILKLIPDVGLILLLEIFEMILKGAFYPRLWENYSVILLQKPSKKDFRPISLASCLY